MKLKLGLKNETLIVNVSFFNALPLYWINATMLYKFILTNYIKIRYNNFHNLGIRQCSREKVLEFFRLHFFYKNMFYAETRRRIYEEI